MELYLQTVVIELIVITANIEVVGPDVTVGVNQAHPYD